jgi:hypothetical protein
MVFGVVGRLLCRTVCLLSIFASFCPLYFCIISGGCVALIEERKRIEVEFSWLDDVVKVSACSRGYSRYQL